MSVKLHLKKTIFAITALVVLGLIFYYFKYIYGWMEFRKNTDTPKQFLNNTIIKKENYTKDSLLIIQKLKQLLLQHEDFFYSKEYFDGTDIIVDTIVYSPDLKKLGVLILTKNPTSRQLVPKEKEMWYYNATSYLGIRQGDTISISHLGSYFVDYTDKSELSNNIRGDRFRTFVSKDTTKVYAYKYNFNDIRFWTSTVWEKIEEDKIKRKEFEEMKLKHPENVYKPPK
jgi:hypothetical protein